MNVKSRQQENVEVICEVLLESVFFVFIEYGYGGVFIDVIVCEVCVIKGVFYYYFGSKQELFVECYECQVWMIVEDLDRVLVYVDKWVEVVVLVEVFIDSVMVCGKW